MSNLSNSPLNCSLKTKSYWAIPLDMKCESIARCTFCILRPWLGHPEYTAFQILGGRTWLDGAKWLNLHLVLVNETLPLPQCPQIVQSSSALNHQILAPMSWPRHFSIFPLSCFISDVSPFMLLTELSISFVPIQVQHTLATFLVVSSCYVLCCFVSCPYINCSSARFGFVLQSSNPCPISSVTLYILLLYPSSSRSNPPVKAFAVVL